MNVPGDAGDVTKYDGTAHWIEDDILRLHGLLLEKSLHDLFDSRASAVTREDILEWILSPRDKPNPFSYWACCRLFGLDPEEIRERVLERYRQMCTH